MVVEVALNDIVVNAVIADVVVDIVVVTNSDGVMLIETVKVRYSPMDGEREVRTNEKITPSTNPIKITKATNPTQT